MKSTYISRFTPRAMSHEDLEAMFVQRHKLAEHLVERIRDSAETENKHFRLLIGPRGIGKTHLLALVYHRVAKLDDLRDKLLIAWLQEEEWGVASFLHLLLSIFRALGQEYPQEYQAKLQDSVKALAQIYQNSPDEALFRAEALLREFADGRSLLVLMENLDDMFEGLGDIGQKQLRGYINNYSFLTIVATAQSLFNAVKLKDSPFYGFFRQHDLEELQAEEAVSLLKNLAELQGNQDLESFLQTPLGRSRIQAVHHLAGGNPRIYIVFSEFLSRESLDNLVDHFMRALDELTPYYQHRMAALSPEERKIVEFLSDARQAVPRLEIAQGCFLREETASRQLEDLNSKGYVRPASQFGEEFYNEFYYELREPLMRFCLEVKKQRGEPIKLFLDFLRIWYSPAELRQRLTVLPADAKLEREYVMRALKEYDADRQKLPIETYLKEYKAYRDNKDHASALEVAEKLVANRGKAEDWLEQGVCLFNLKRYEEALAVLKKAIEFDPNNAKAWTYQGRALGATEHYEEALDSLGKAAEFDEDFVSAWAYRGLALENLERHEEALSSYDKAIEIDPKYAWAWAYRGDVLEQLERYEEALASYDRATELDPNDALAWAYRGHSLNQVGRHEEALASYDKAIEINPNYDWAWGNRGDVLDRLERYEEALASYDKAIEIDPKYAWAWAHRGYSLNLLERYEEALASYNKAIEINPNYDWAWGNRGDVLDRLERYEEALASYDKAIEIDPKYAWAWANRAYSLDQLKRYEEALASFDKAIEIDTNYDWAWARRGYSLNQLERHEEALESYEKAIEIDPKYAWAWANRGYSLDRLKRYEEALASYNKAIEIDPKYAWAWAWRGEVLDNLERYEEALESYDKAIEIDPNYAWAWASRGDVLDNMERYEEALESYDKAIELDPNDKRAWFSRGWLLDNMGRYEEALASCDKAIALGYNSSNVFFNRAIAILGLNRWEQGIVALNDAFQRFEPDEQADPDDAELIIRQLLEQTQDAVIWKTRLSSLIEIYDKHQALSILAQGLARSISSLIPDSVKDLQVNNVPVQGLSPPGRLCPEGRLRQRQRQRLRSARTVAWLETWRELVGDIPEFQISLRLLAAATDYIEKNGDMRVLLALPIEERELLKQILEIE
ncbi:MAG: tetratricopeptide repeat protein [Oscillatoria sp. SIO1A7]|nr:tetratricopeptide repeat protein [Oscillatoria sp. SIO1A7]